MMSLEEQQAMDTTAIVLAGGRGSRMNYKEKAWMLHHGKPLLSHVIDTISPQVDMILISRNNTRDPRYDELPYPCFTDEKLTDEKLTDEKFSNEKFIDRELSDIDKGGDVTEQKGPLSGISACARHVKTPLTLVVPCDTPRLPDNLMQKLLGGLGDASVAVAHDGKDEQPLVFLARTTALEEIEIYLKSGRRSVKGWLDGVIHNRVYFETGSDEFENINTVDQLA